MILLDTIIGKTDTVAVREWLRGRLVCSYEEWRWAQFVLHPEGEDELLF
jgi:hypothetical protein